VKDWWGSDFPPEIRLPKLDTSRTRITFFEATGRDAKGEREFPVRSCLRVGLACGAVALTTSMSSAGFTNETYVSLDMVSSDGNLSLYNSNGFQGMSGAVTFLGGAPFGNSGLNYAVHLATQPGDGVAGAGLGDLDIASFSIVVANNDTTTHYYTLGISIGITTPWSDGTLIGGQVAGLLTDLDGGGAMLSSNFGNALMTGTIDGNPVLAVGTAPFSFTAPAGGSATFSAVDGLPGPSIPGPMVVNSSYGLILSFALGAGDQVEIAGDFQVLYIPGPASLAVLALGAVATRRRRR
jgi:hypothetical protein